MKCKVHLSFRKQPGIIRASHIDVNYKRRVLPRGIESDLRRRGNPCVGGDDRYNGLGFRAWKTVAVGVLREHQPYLTRRGIERSEIAETLAA